MQHISSWDYNKWRLFSGALYFQWKIYHNDLFTAHTSHMTVDTVSLCEVPVVPGTVRPPPIADIDRLDLNSILPGPTDQDGTTGRKVCSESDQTKRNQTTVSWKSLKWPFKHYKDRADFFSIFFSITVTFLKLQIDLSFQWKVIVVPILDVSLSMTLIILFLFKCCLTWFKEAFCRIHLFFISVSAKTHFTCHKIIQD